MSYEYFWHVEVVLGSDHVEVVLGSQLPARSQLRPSSRGRESKQCYFYNKTLGENEAISSTTRTHEHRPSFHNQTSTEWQPQRMNAVF